MFRGWRSYDLTPGYLMLPLWGIFHSLSNGRSKVISLTLYYLNPGLILSGLFAANIAFFLEICYLVGIICCLKNK